MGRIRIGRTTRKKTRKSKVNGNKKRCNTCGRFR